MSGIGVQTVNALIERLMRWGVRFSTSFQWTGYLKPMPKWLYFSDSEVEGLDLELVSKLDTARRLAGVPFRITSGLRTCAANQAAMGVEGSAHLKGLAVDLSVDTGTERFAIVKALLASGFVRVGIYDRHCHVDIDLEKPQNVIWTGVSH